MLFDDAAEFSFDDDDNPEVSLTSLTAVQECALKLFGRFLSRISGKELSQEIPEGTRRFLTLSEIENIMREYGEETEDGFFLSGDSAEELRVKFSGLMSALLKRILSNTLSEGVKAGLLDCEFDADKNDFQFDVTDKGKQLYVRDKNNGSNSGTSEDGD